MLLTYLGVPSHADDLLYAPWTLFTYMFTHLEFFHLLINLLWLFWFGSIFLNHFSERKLIGVYLLGGMGGALLYTLLYTLYPVFTDGRTIGASASVMAVVFAVSTYLPNHRIQLFLFGSVKLIHLALFTVLIDIISLPSGNAGGHIAHLGGALFGYLFTLGVRANRDITAWITYPLYAINGLSSPKKTGTTYAKNASQMSDREYNAHKKRQDARMNEILDKISKSGYASLTKEEKEVLFKSGKHH